MYFTVKAKIKNGKYALETATERLYALCISVLTCYVNGDFFTGTSLTGCGASGLSNFDDKAVTILHQGVTEESQLRLVALAFSVPPGIGIGGRGMNVVAAFLALEVNRRIAAALFREVYANILLNIFINNFSCIHSSLSSQFCPP